MKGLFIPGITEKMFKNASVESVAELMVEGKVYDIDYQEPCEDVISRAEAIKGLGEQPLVWTDSNSEIQQLLDWREHKEMLEKLPSVGQKVGHWKLYKEFHFANIYECSECKETVWAYKDANHKWNYCPNCGAKMESEVEE